MGIIAVVFGVLVFFWVIRDIAAALNSVANVIDAVASWGETSKTVTQGIRPASA